jgi:predicted HicB family RNase H-like nuclease
MSNLLSYRNYNGTVEYSREDGCLFGKVVGIKSLLSYEGESIAELEKDFQESIDDYIADCEARGVLPEQPYKGSFNVRINPDLHRTIAIYAMEHDETLNAAVEQAITQMVAAK